MSARAMHWSNTADDYQERNSHLSSHGLCFCRHCYWIYHILLHKPKWYKVLAYGEWKPPKFFISTSLKEWQEKRLLCGAILRKLWIWNMRVHYQKKDNRCSNMKTFWKHPKKNSTCCSINESTTKLGFAQWKDSMF